MRTRRPYHILDDGHLMPGNGSASVGFARWKTDEPATAGRRDRLDSIGRIVTIAPNPFNALTEIRFASEAAAHAEIRIYDIKGRRVTSLELGRITAGVGSVQWDGTDAAGQEVASGLYLFELRTNSGRRDVKRAVLVK